MFCSKCGKPTEGDQIVCPECAAAAQAAENAQPQVELEQPAVQPEQPIEVPSFIIGEEPVVIKKKSKKPLIFGVVAAVLAVAVAATAVFFPYAKSFFNRTFLPAEKYMQKVETANVGKGSAVDVLGTYYGKALQNMTNPIDSVEYNVSLNVGDELMDLAGSFIAANGLDLDWFKSVAVDVKAGTQNDTQMGGDIGLQLNGKNILTASVFMDLTQGMYYMGLPELSQTYLAMSLQNLGLDTLEVRDGFASLMEQYQEMSEEMAEVLPDEQTMEELVQKYISVALGAIEDVEKETEKVTIDNVSQKFTVLTAELSEEDFVKMGIAVLKEVKNDDTIKSIVEAVAEYAAEMTAQMYEEYGVDAPVGKDVDSLMEEFYDGIDETIDDLKDYDAEDDEVLTIKTYVNMKDEICGRAIEVDGDEVFYSLMVRSGKKWESKMVIADTVEITGAGTEAKNLMDGTLKVEVESEEICELEIIGYDTKAAEAGSLIGTFRLTPGEDVYDLMDMGAAASILGSKEPALELKLATGSMEVNILLDGELLVGVGVSAKTNTGYKPSRPANSMNIGNMEDIEQWVSYLNIEKIKSALVDAGVPAEYVDMLDNLENMFGASVAPDIAW